MKNQSELQQIIRDNVSNIEYWYWFTAPFSDEYVFIVISKPFWHNVKLVIFDKPYKKIEGVLHVAKISDHATLEGAKEKAESVQSQLQNLSIPRTCLSAYLKDEKFLGDFGEFTTVRDMIGKIHQAGVYKKGLTVHPSCADNYFKPLDVIKISRGSYKHVGVYLGGNWICHVPGGKSDGKEASMAKKETLDNFFLKQEGNVVVCRPIVSFKEKEQIIQHIARSIVGEFGKNEYDLFKNNCEHFANMLVYGTNYSQQGDDGKYLTTSNQADINFKREVEACASLFDNLKIGDYNKLNNLTNEIRALAQEATQGQEQWETRVQVNNDFSLHHLWCKIQ